jgi:hypothetical protein
VHVPSERLNLLIIGFVERPETTQHVGRLPHHEPEIRQIEGDILEPEQRPRFSLVSLDGCRREIEQGERHATLNSALQLEELEMHVHGARQFGMLRSKGLQLQHFA